MAVGDGPRRGMKLDDGSSAIDKRYYGRSRKQRVRPAPDDFPPDSPAPAPAAEVLLPQPSPPAEATPVTDTTPGAVVSATAVVSSALLSGQPPATPSYSPTSSSASPSGASFSNNQPPFRKGSSSSLSQNSRADKQPEAPEGPEQREPQSHSDLEDRPHRPRRPRRHRNSGNNHPPTSRGLPRLSGRLRSASRRRRHRGTSSPPDVRSRPLGRTPSSSATDTEYESSSYSSGGGEQRSDWSSTDTTAEHSSRERQSRRKNRRSSRSSDRKRHSGYRKEDDDEYCRRRRYRSREGRRHDRHRGDRRYDERRYSRDRRHEREMSSDRGKRSKSTRHSSRSHRGGDGRRRRRRSRGSDGEDAGRAGRTRQKHHRYKHSDHGGRQSRHRDLSGSSDTERRRHDRGGKRDSGGGRKKSVPVDHSQHQGGLPRLTRVSTVAGGKAEALKKAEAERRRQELRERNLQAVVTVQRIARGVVARNRVTGRRQALAILRSACLDVAMDVVEAHIREEAAPNMISEILAGGFEGGEVAAQQRADAAEAAGKILEETTASLVREIVTLVVTGEANDHLDTVFVRDRRNPLLATVDDVVAETLRILIREAVVVEVVKECAEEFMFDKRILALVAGLIEDGVVESVGPVVAEVYYKAAALAAYVEMEEELCAEEARSIVAETMAPFEDQLAEMQREKDFAAIQAAAQSAIVKGLQLQHAARTVGQRGRLVLMSDISGRTLNLLLAGRFLAILRAAETSRLQVSTSPLLFTLFRRLVVRTGRSVLLEELSRELDRDETTLHALELERIDEVDRQRRRRAVRERDGAEGRPSSASMPASRDKPS